MCYKMVPSLLRYLHIAAALIHLVSCVLSVIVHTDTITGQLTFPVHTYAADPTSTIKELIVNETVTHKTVLYSNPMVWISANEGFTFFSHLIALFLMDYAKDIIEFERTRRTIEYMLTAGILQVALVLGVGSMAMSDLFMLLILNGVIQVLGWVSDQKDLAPELVNYVKYSAFVLLAVEVQYVIFQSVNLEGIDSAPYIVMGIMYAIFYLGFGVVKLLPMLKKEETEIYILMSVSSKVALSWILIGNTYEGLKELNIDSAPLDHTDLPWRAIQYVISGVCFAILLVGIPLILNTSSENLSSGMVGTSDFRERRENYKYNQITTIS